MADMTMQQMIEIQEIRLLKELDDITGFFQIMVFLQKFGQGNISNFVKDLRLNQSVVYRTLERLTELGLVTTMMGDSARRGNFKSKYYHLTGNGQKIAKHILKMFEVYRKMK